MKRHISTVDFPPRRVQSPLRRGSSPRAPRQLVQPVLSLTVMQNRPKGQSEDITELDDPFVDESDQFLDPAQRVLLAAKEAKLRRKKEETRLELEKIQERIQNALQVHEFQFGEKDKEEGEDGEAAEVDFRTIESPEQLHELLRDARLRAKYQRRVMVLMVDYEEAMENREKILLSLQQFFQETRAGNTEQLLKEVASEEIDLDEATAGLEGALVTAQVAAKKMVEIKKDMSHLFSIVKTYPDTKKGRRKLEKALLKAQEEVEELKAQVERTKKELDQTNDKSCRLQKQIDFKNIECEKLRKVSSHVDQLQQTNTSLTSELATVKESLDRAKTDLQRQKEEIKREKEREKERKESVETESTREIVKIDEVKVQELEDALEEEKSLHAAVEAKLAAQESEFEREREALVREHETEVEEMRGRYEEQMKSLMVDDLFSDAGSQGEEIGRGGSDADLEEKEREEEEIDAPETLGGETTSYEAEASGLGSHSFVEHLKSEYRQKEKKLMEEIKELKNKSRKSLTSLKAQLMEAENKHADQLSSLKKEVAVVTKEKENLEEEKKKLTSTIAGFDEAKAQLEVRLEEAAKREQKDEMVSKLQQDLEMAVATKLDGRGPEMASQLMQQVSHSEQWSEIPSHLGEASPRSLEAGSLLLSSQPLLTLIPMDEVLHGSTSSLLQADSHLHNLRGTPFFPTSLQHSATSVNNPPPFGSSQQPEAPPLGYTHPQDALQMLSRLSHHSAPNTVLSADHPIVSEWTKAYDMVVRLRNNIVDMLSDDARFADEVEDLQSIEAHSLDRGQDLQSEVTRMRFCLALMLHQMEHTLQEAFSKTTEGGEEGYRGGGGGGTGRGLGRGEEGDGEGEKEMKRLKSTLSQLKKRLRQSEEIYKSELQESKVR